MQNSMSCDDAEEWLGAVADREAPQRQARAVLGHIECCPRCGGEYRNLLQWKRCALSLANQQASSSLQARISEALRLMSPPSCWPDSLHHPAAIPRRARFGRAAGIVLLLVILAAAAALLAQRMAATPWGPV